MQILSRLCFPVLWLAICVQFCSAEQLSRREWKVSGLLREALICAPAAAKTNASPLVFAFHGHGGSMNNAARSFHIETLWPEAIVVYMQGVNTPGRLTDPEGKKPGWQNRSGDHDDRDLKFFDAVLTGLKKEYKVDAKRIYSTGHSNGGAFTYLLALERGELFAAFAPSSAISPHGGTHHGVAPVFGKPTRMNPSGIFPGPGPVTNKSTAFTNYAAKPILHIAGEKDDLVKFEWQKRWLAALRKFHQCGEGKPWEHDKRCIIYASKSERASPIITYIHPGGHRFPSEAPEIIVNFLKRHVAD